MSAKHSSVLFLRQFPGLCHTVVWLSVTNLTSWIRSNGVSVTDDVGFPGVESRLAYMAD